MVLIVMGLSFLSVGYFSCFGIHQPISQSIQAIEAKNLNEDDVKETTVKIEGTLTKRLFYGNTFKGQIEVAGYDWSNTSIQLLKEGEEGILQGVMTSNRNSAEIDVIFYVTPDFSQIDLHINDTDSVVVGPATTKEEAQAIDLIKQYMGE